MQMNKLRCSARDRCGPGCIPERLLRLRFRVRPGDIALPDQDPFQNDLLERNEPVEVLTQASTSIKGPSVVAIDAGCGTGKAAFVRIWARRLRNQEFRVVEANVGETDFLGDPYIALSTELTDGLPGRGTRLKWQESDTNGRKTGGVLGSGSAGVWVGGGDGTRWTHIGTVKFVLD